MSRVHTTHQTPECPQRGESWGAELSHKAARRAAGRGCKLRFAVERLWESLSQAAERKPSALLSLDHYRDPPDLVNPELAPLLPAFTAPEGSSSGPWSHLFENANLQAERKLSGPENKGSSQHRGQLDHQESWKRLLNFKRLRIPSGFVMGKQ